MRLFTGLEPAPLVKARLAGAMAELRDTAQINWAPPDNLHITSKFIGEWPDDRLAELESALGGVAVRGPIAVTMVGFGFFPNPHQPHSFFAAVQENEGLMELAAAIDGALAPLGCPRESKPYRPHVTLARIKHRQEIRGLRARVAAMSDHDFGSFAAASFHLYQSRPTDAGSVYTKLATYDLMRENN